MLYAPSDWDNAYANTAHIPNGDAWPERWAAPARLFREAMGERAEIGIAYGAHERERYDLFHPETASQGFVVFVHGGYWVRLDPSVFSHLAAGPLAHGWSVAMPGYTLAPEARVSVIARQVGTAIAHAAERIDGPVRLIGHSAGGQIVTRLVCADGPLPGEVAQRVQRTVSVSGVHDLRPVLRIAENDAIGLDRDEAWRESPALLEPREGTELVTWVGQSERAEFVRQSELLASIWRGLGARTGSVVEPDRHHFDVIEGLNDPRSPLCEALLRD